MSLRSRTMVSEIADLSQQLNTLLTLPQHEKPLKRWKSLVADGNNAENQSLEMYVQSKEKQNGKA